HPWHDLTGFALDGSTLRVADSEENREHFGLADGRSESGDPLVRLAALIAARSHLLGAAAFGHCPNSEHHYAKALWPSTPPNSVTLVDRNFLAANILLGIQNGPSRHWLTRAKSTTKWMITKKLGVDDLLVELTVSDT